MQDDWIGKRAYPRLDMKLPVHFGLIDIRGRRKLNPLFSAETMDVSMKGLGIRMNRQILQMIPIAINLMGDNKRYDLKIGIHLGGDEILAVGEVKWSLLEIPHQLKMGVFIKGMGHEEEGKWTSFIEKQYREGVQKTGSTFRVIESIQTASNHLDKASSRIRQQMETYEPKQGKRRGRFLAPAMTKRRNFEKRFASAVAKPRATS